MQQRKKYLPLKVKQARLASRALLHYYVRVRKRRPHLAGCNTASHATLLVEESFFTTYYPPRQSATMDVVLEVFDTLLFDRLYANLLPAFPQPQKSYAPDGTYSSMRQAPTAYTYEPASQFLPSFLEPSDFINMSRMPRNDPLRQFISLYTITTYVSNIRPNEM